MKFDELNKLEDYDYFEPMAINEDDKARRRELADLLIDVFIYFFSVYEVHRMHNSMLEKALYEQLLTDRISDAVSKVTGIDEYISNHIRTLSKEVVDTTFKNAGKEKSDTDITNAHKTNPFSTSFSTPSISSRSESLDSPFSVQTSDSHVREDEDGNAKSDYWLSYERASNIANSETNTFLNYTDFVEAKERGYTHKSWLTMLDNKVRDTHEEVEGQTIGIDEPFHVGNSEMRFPHDLALSPDPKEVINCRCAVEYK